MIKEIFDFEYTNKMYPARLKPLEEETLKLGMSEEAIKKYYSLVEKLYHSFELEYRDEFIHSSPENRRGTQLDRIKIYNSLIAHLFKQDAISDDVYCELHNRMSIELQSIEHPYSTGEYIRDSIDDFRLSFERCILECNATYSDYLDDRYGYSVCVKPNTPTNKTVTSEDLYIVRFEDGQPDIHSFDASYWEVLQLLKTIQKDIKDNEEEQSNVDRIFFKTKSCSMPFFPGSHKFTYPLPNNIQEWYSVKQALSTDAYELEKVEQEVKSILDTMEKPKECVGFGATLYIYKGKIRCRKHNHHIVPATAIMCNLSDKEIELDVEYCPECNRYMLNYVSFDQYRTKHGLLIGNLKMIVSGETEIEYEMADMSPLKLCGYNVSQAEGLSSKTRQFLLSKIIYEGIMSKLEIIHYLEHFIIMNGSKTENAIALDKWREDLDFVHKYDKTTQPKTYISKIEKY